MLMSVQKYVCLVHCGYLENSKLAQLKVLIQLALAFDVAKTCKLPAMQ